MKLSHTALRSVGEKKDYRPNMIVSLLDESLVLISVAQ